MPLYPFARKNVVIQFTHYRIFISEISHFKFLITEMSQLFQYSAAHLLMRYKSFTQAVKVHLENVVLHQADIFFHPYCVSYSLDGKYRQI